ncbi:MAG: CBS domain-containing protein [Rectinemataceae bacterium]|jgi:CBS domain-containing protein/anti-sigma regulatory factor (Ser/Thr protein kinase)
MSVLPISPETGPQVVLEILYRLKVRDAMSSPVITASPEDSMRQVQYRMRDNEISGVPIVEGERLVGLVSMGHVIEALDTGRIGERASELMTRTVIALENDMPLAFATTYFNRYKFGRFPVLDRNGRLVGIVCASDIIRALLIAMNKEVERLEEKLSAADASTDRPADGLVRLGFQVTRFDFENAGKASAEIKKALKSLGVDASIVRRAAVASYELELNEAIHSEGGSISCVAGAGRIEIVAEDRGPGIPDVAAAMTEGFSTANEWIRSLGFGAGMGLPNAKRVSDDFSIDSGQGRGTFVRVVIHY